MPEPIDRPALEVLRDWMASGRRCALLTIVNIDGTSPRSIGAQMVVSESGDWHGYLTGGCLEKEFGLVGQQVIADRQNRLIRYGKDSPFFDLKLPCGSGIDVYFDQALTQGLVNDAMQRQKARQPFVLRTDLTNGASSLRRLKANETHQSPASEHQFDRLYTPPLRLNLYGAGSAALQIAHFAREAGLDLNFAVADEQTLSAANALGLTQAIQLNNQLFASDDWTATVLAFHEHERELPILTNVLSAPGFYIGAMGSLKVSKQRLQALIDARVPPSDLAKLVQSPGLIQGARSATELGVGIVADILDTARRNGLHP